MDELALLAAAGQKVEHHTPSWQERYHLLYLELMVSCRPSLKLARQNDFVYPVHSWHGLAHSPVRYMHMSAYVVPRHIDKCVQDPSLTPPFASSTAPLHSRLASFAMSFDYG